MDSIGLAARDPDALKAWYERALGVPPEKLMRSDGLVFGIFHTDTDYFGWAADPEGNRFELWEPAEGM